MLVLPPEQRPEVLNDDEVCACLNDTGERKVRLYERCLRCGVFMEADDVAALLSTREVELAEAEEYLRRSVVQTEEEARRAQEAEVELRRLRGVEKAARIYRQVQQETPGLDKAVVLPDARKALDDALAEVGQVEHGPPAKEVGGDR